MGCTPQLADSDLVLLLHGRTFHRIFKSRSDVVGYWRFGVRCCRHPQGRTSHHNWSVPDALHEL